MHPTGAEQLRGVRRALAAVAEDEALAPEHREALVDAARVLERLEASWPARLGFLLADNRATEALLAELGADIPSSGAPAASAEAAAPGGCEVRRFGVEYVVTGKRRMPRVTSVHYDRERLERSDRITLVHQIGEIKIYKVNERGSSCPLPPGATGN